MEVKQSYTGRAPARPLFTMQRAWKIFLELSTTHDCPENLLPSLVVSLGVTLVVGDELGYVASDFRSRDPGGLESDGARGP